MDHGSIILASSVRIIGKREVALGPMRCRGLLAVLALQPNIVVAYDRLASMLWNDPIESARPNLRSLATGIRAALRRAGVGTAVELRTHRAAWGGTGGYSLEMPRSQIDLHRVHLLKRQSKDCLEADPSRAKRICEEAIDLRVGNFGPGLPSTLWFEQQRERFVRIQHSLHLLHGCISVMLGEYGGEFTALQHVQAADLSTSHMEATAIQLYCQGHVLASLEQLRLADRRCREVGLDLPDSSRRIQKAILDDDKDTVIEETRNLARSL